MRLSCRFIIKTAETRVRPGCNVKPRLLMNLSRLCRADVAHNRLSLLMIARGTRRGETAYPRILLVGPVAKVDANLVRVYLLIVAILREMCPLLVLEEVKREDIFLVPYSIFVKDACEDNQPQFKVGTECLGEDPRDPGHRKAPAHAHRETHLHVHDLRRLHTRLQFVDKAPLRKFSSLGDFADSLPPRR